MCVFSREGCNFCHEEFFQNVGLITSGFGGVNRLFIDCLGCMAVDNMKKRLLGLTQSKRTLLGPHFYPHPSGLGRMRAPVSIFDFLCPYIVMFVILLPLSKLYHCAKFHVFIEKCLINLYYHDSLCTNAST